MKGRDSLGLEPARDVVGLCHALEKGGEHVYGFWHHHLLQMVGGHRPLWPRHGWWWFLFVEVDQFQNDTAFWRPVCDFVYLFFLKLSGDKIGVKGRKRAK